jgi:uncharacterized protein YkwD
MTRGTTLVGLIVLSCTVLVRAEAPKPAPAVELTDEEKQVLELTNAERAKKKLPPLAVNQLLVKVARGHSANMAKQKDLNHILDGKNPGQRTLKEGYDYGLVGENIGLGKCGATAKDVVIGWMESEHHRANILGEKFTEIGIGIATNSDGESYYTQLFARPRKKRN